jgi:hypothetical protein
MNASGVTIEQFIGKWQHYMAGWIIEQTPSLEQGHEQLVVLPILPHRQDACSTRVLWSQGGSGAAMIMTMSIPNSSWFGCTCYNQRPSEFRMGVQVTQLGGVLTWKYPKKYIT